MSGVFGSVHNYLSYSNSVFFFNVGGWGKNSQGVIAMATLILFVIGPQIINFVPRIIAGVIMFHLGYDLVYDAIIESRPALDSLEYMSVLFVGSVVMMFGFVTGNALFNIVNNTVSCVVCDNFSSRHCCGWSICLRHFCRSK